MHSAVFSCDTGLTPGRRGLLHGLGGRWFQRHVAPAWRRRCHGAGKPQRAFSIEVLEPRVVLDSTVVFSEIMYNPPGSDDRLEWIELHNQNAVDVDVSAWQLAGGIQFTFPEGTVLRGGEYAVVAADPQRLLQEQGVADALGPFTSRLANSGETVELRERSGRQMDLVKYGDGGDWPVAADGSGATLSKIDPDQASGPARNWTHSIVVGGTPGARNFPDPIMGTATARLALNEVSAAQAAPFFVELVNEGDEPINLDGYVLATSSGAETRLGNQTVNSGELAVLTGDQLGLHVSAGDRLFLYRPGRDAVEDAVIVTSRLRGRTPGGDWHFPAEPTPGTANRFAFQQNVVINEIMYHAPGERVQTSGAFVPADEEWIELYNRGDTAVDLTGWSLEDGVQFAFPSGTMLQSGAYLVVARDATTMAADYPSIRVVGDFSGRLDNGTDRIILVDAAGNPADAVEYFDSGRWASAADGGGSSLELRDPNADNSRPEAWIASDEGRHSDWHAYSYQATTPVRPTDANGRWQELVVGLLAPGEVWLDDIQVVEDPGGAARQLIQNGTFQHDSPGSDANTWRTIGNHRHSQVIADPNDPANHVLQLVATGPTEHKHNHAETTLKNGVEYITITPDTEYEISFRAKWISGSNQLNTRLYFDRVARTTLIERPAQHGTPGTRNSMAVDNAGPTYDQFQHAPVVPAPFAPVTVSVAADDPEGVADMTLWYAVDSGSWQSRTMVLASSGVYVADIPGHQAGTIIQFYVEGHDTRGAASTFPAAGPQSRALYKVDDGLAATNGLHNLRLILTPDDADFLHTDVELMSNDYLGATVIYDEREVFYDAGVRLSGSQRARPYTPRLSFAVRFGTDQLFRGVHRTLTIDRSESTGFGQRELLIHHGMAHAGGFGGEYNDLIQVIPPRLEHTGPAELQLARFTDVFLDSMFDRGGDGQLFEYEGIYRPDTTDDGTPEGRKRPQPDTFIGTRIKDLGNDKEQYRWFFEIKNNREADDYSRLIQFAKTMGFVGDAFDDQIADVIDVDEFLRAFAVSVISGAGDNYGSNGAPHNAQFYVRPEDNKVLFLPHDLDAFFDATRPLLGGSVDLRKLIAVPAWKRLYLGHVHDMITTTFNRDYMARWTGHFGALLPDQDFPGHLEFIDQRATFLLDQIKLLVPPVGFAITSGDGANVTVNSGLATLEGSGWVNVRQIRLAGSYLPLAAEWDAVDHWQVPVHVGSGANEVTLEAYDFAGDLIGSDTITVISTAVNATRDPLRITEINYNPYPPTAGELAANPTLDNDDFEFIEVTNVGIDAIPLDGIRLVEGVEFAFPPRELGPGRSAVVVKDRAAFGRRYGTGVDVLGEFSDGKLSNAGETIALEDPGHGTVFRVTYDDRGAWPDRADGHGPTLEVVDTLGDYHLPANWRSSFAVGGTPGSDGTGPGTDVMINELIPRDPVAGPDLIELYNSTDRPIDISGWYLSDEPADLLKYTIPNGLVIGAGEYLSLTAAQVGFELDERTGGALWLVEAAAGSGLPIRVADHIEFDAVAAGASLGRWPNALVTGIFVPLSTPTPGAANRGPVPADVILSEVNYHPRLATFSQDFDSGTANGFVPRLGTWSVEDGAYTVIPGPEKTTLATIPLATPLADDFTLAATARVSSTSDFSQNGLVVFDYQSPTDFKFAGLFAGGGNWRLGSHDESGWHFLARVNEPIAKDVNHTVVVEITGSLACLVADGTEKIRFDFGTPLADGLVGLGTKNGQAWFDNISVKPRRDETQFEYVELTNATDDPVDLSGWRLTYGAGWSFAEGTTIGSGESLLLVGFDPADTAVADQFRRIWGMDRPVALFGPYTTGSLANDGEILKLVRPLDPDAAQTGFTFVDQLTYGDRPPWPAGADGAGPSLQRISAAGFGTVASSWRAAEPTPGVAALVAPGDLNLDGRIDADDIDAFVLALANPSAYHDQFGQPATLSGDTDRDGDVDFDDIDDFLALLNPEPWPTLVDHVLATPTRVPTRPVRRAPVDGSHRRPRITRQPPQLAARPHASHAEVWHALNPRRRAW